MAVCAQNQVYQTNIFTKMTKYVVSNGNGNSCLNHFSSIVHCSKYLKEHCI